MIKLHDFGRRGAPEQKKHVPVSALPIGTLFGTPESLVNHAEIFVVIGSARGGVIVLSADTLKVYNLDCIDVGLWDCEWHCSPTV